MPAIALDLGILEEGGEGAVEACLVPSPNADRKRDNNAARVTGLAPTTWSEPVGPRGGGLA